MEMEQRVLALENQVRQLNGTTLALMGACISLVATHSDRRALLASLTRMAGHHAKMAESNDLHAQTRQAMNQFMNLLHESLSESPAPDLSQAETALKKFLRPE